MSEPREETIRLGDALDELDDQLDQLAASLQTAEDGTASAAVLQRSANEIDTQGADLSGLVDEYGEDAEVTVRGLDAGEYARVEDRVAAMRAGTDEPGGLPGSSRNVWAAAGLVDAPFLDDDAGFDAKIQTVAAQDPGVAKWLEARVNDLTSVSEGNWTPLRERL